MGCKPACSISKHHIAWSILILCAFAVYANTFRNPFLWDDNIFILENTLIQDLRHFPELFTRAFFLNPDSQTGDYYRPLISLSFMFDYFVWEKIPLGYHLTNLIFHIFNTLLVYSLGTVLLGRSRPAFWAALLFAIHPIQTEAVAYIPSRVDLIGTFFYLSAWFLFDRAVRSRAVWKLAAAVILFLCALLSKEMTTTLPIILFCYGFVFLGEERRRAFLYAVPFWILIGAFFVFRSFFIPLTAQPMGSLLSGLPRALISSGSLILSYFGLLIFPNPLYMERRHQLVQSIRDPQGILFLIFTGLLIAAFWGLRKKRTERFLLSAGLLALLPVLNIIPIYPSMAEHYLYLPSVAIFLLVAGLFDDRWIRLPSGALKKSCIYISVFFLICYGARTILRNHDYRDEIAFLEQTKQYAPWSAIAHNNLGGLYLMQGRTQEGIGEFEEVLALDPHNVLALTNLGIAYRNTGDYEKALECYTKSIEIDPRSRSYNQLGVFYGMYHKFPEAEEAFRKAISLDPDFSDAYYNLGKTYWDQQKWPEVKAIWMQGLEKDPQHYFMRAWIGKIPGHMR